MNLFIIGNGFDLGHNLPTKYWDFRCFLEENREVFLRDFEEKYYLSNEELKTLLWNNFEYNLANLQEDVLVEELFQSTDLGLESGNIGIEDTLDYYFDNEFQYVENLTIYLKEWIEVVNSSLDKLNRQTSLINEKNQDLFINFNYTTTLEKVYNISEENVLHVHGIVDTDDDLVLGHSNSNQIAYFKEKIKLYQNEFDEQNAPIYKILADYCQKTYKDVNMYIYQLTLLNFEQVDKIIVVGHSLGDVDLPYFKVVNENVNEYIEWHVYYRNEEDINVFKNKLVQLGIDEHKIKFIHSDSFYNQLLIEEI